MNDTQNIAALTERDYEEFEAKIRETSRGRSFLNELTRRNRAADTHTILDAISMMEYRVMQSSGAEIPIKVRESLAEMSRAISQARSEVASSANEHHSISLASNELDSIVKATEIAASDILGAAEKVQEKAWTMREQGLDDTLCDQLDFYATQIYTACSFQDITGQRTAKVVETLRFIEGRLNTLLEIWGDPDDIVKGDSDFDEPSATMIPEEPGTVVLATGEGGIDDQTSENPEGFQSGLPEDSNADATELPPSSEDKAEPPAANPTPNLSLQNPAQGQSPEPVLPGTDETERDIRNPTAVAPQEQPILDAPMANANLAEAFGEATSASEIANDDVDPVEVFLKAMSSRKIAENQTISQEAVTQAALEQSSADIAADDVEKAMPTPKIEKGDDNIPANLEAPAQTEEPHLDIATAPADVAVEESGRISASGETENTPASELEEDQMVVVEFISDSVSSRDSDEFSGDPADASLTDEPTLDDAPLRATTAEGKSKQEPVLKAAKANADPVESLPTEEDANTGADISADLQHRQAMLDLTQAIEIEISRSSLAKKPATENSVPPAVTTKRGTPPAPAPISPSANGDGPEQLPEERRRISERNMRQNSASAETGNAQETMIANAGISGKDIKIDIQPEPGPETNTLQVAEEALDQAFQDNEEVPELPGLRHATALGHADTLASFIADPLPPPAPLEPEDEDESVGSFVKVTVSAINRWSNGRKIAFFS